MPGAGKAVLENSFRHYAIPYYTALVDKGFTYTHFSHVRHGFSSARFEFASSIHVRLSRELLRAGACETHGRRTYGRASHTYRKLETTASFRSPQGDADQYISVPY